MRTPFYSKYFKRLLDFTLAWIALILLSPVIAITYFLVRRKMGSPVIFKQDRPGKDANIFSMYKFRTMTVGTDDNGDLLPDEVRLTSFGKFLRSTSLDELPGLINILKGDMSIVGPRPLLVSYLPLYSDEQNRRHLVRPGLTGLAQVNGRNLITWEERFKYDLDYVEDITFTNDVKIIFLTIKKVFVREGISSDNSVTMEPFKGSNL